MIPRSENSGWIYSDFKDVWYQDYSSGYAAPVSLGSRPFKAEKRSFSGFDIPDYHKKRKRGDLLPHTPFEKFFATITSTSVSFRNTWTASTWRDYHDVTDVYVQDMVDQSLPPCPNVINQDYFVQKSASKIYSEGWDAATFLGELVETRRMFKGVAGRIWDLATNPSLSKVLNAWMEGRYGWRPLINDVQTFYEVATKFDRLRERYSKRSSAEETQLSSNTVNNSTSLYTDVTTTNTETLISVTGAVTADIYPPRFAINPVVTGWELVPLSFVLDWAINVGTALEAMSFLYLQRQYTASGGYLVRITETRNRTISDLGSGYPVYGTRTYTTEKVVTYVKRTPMSVPITPINRLRLDPYKVLDALVLVKQRLF